MPIIFKSKLSSAVANATFLDKTIDDIKKGKLSLYKVSLVEPLFIDDVQASLWKCFDVVGIAGEFDANALVYATNNYLTNGENHKQSLEAFDVAVNAIQLKTYANELIAVDGELSIDLTAYEQYRRVSGDAAPVNASITPFGDVTTLVDGAKIHIRGTDNTNTVNFQDNDNDFGFRLFGSAELFKGYVLTVIWDDIDLRFYEIGRNF